MAPVNQTKEVKRSKAAGESLRTTAARRVSFPAEALSAPKVLRIGIIQGGKILEEKIIRSRENVTIGLFEKNTFIIPSPLLPGRLVLFEMRGDRYYLNVREYMEGKISSSKGVQELAGCKYAKRIALDENSKGRIIVGEATLLFQFVNAPPVQPKPQLPSSMRGGWFKSFIADWFFNSLVTVSLLVHIVPLIYLVAKDWPVMEQGFDVDNVYFQAVLQPPDEELIKKMTGQEAADGQGEASEEEEAVDAENMKSPEKVSNRPKRVLTAEEKAALEAQRRAKLEAQVSKSGILAPIGSEADGAGGTGADLLAVGGVDSDIDKVMESVSGVKTASAADVGSSLRLPADSAGGGKVADITAVRVAKADVDLDTDSAKETKVKGKTKMGKPDEVGGSGILSAKEVTSVIRARATAIEMCYQKALNKNYGLQGKLKVRFTIGTSGRVTKVTVEEDTLGDPDVATCVMSKFKTFKFSEPEGGPVEFVFPFVFKPAG